MGMEVSGPAKIVYSDGSKDGGGHTASGCSIRVRRAIQSPYELLVPLGVVELEALGSLLAFGNNSYDGRLVNLGDCKGSIAVVIKGTTRKVRRPGDLVVKSQPFRKMDRHGWVEFADIEVKRGTLDSAL